jgi:chorismate lyase
MRARHEAAPCSAHANAGHQAASVNSAGNSGIDMEVLTRPPRERGTPIHYDRAPMLQRAHPHASRPSWPVHPARPALGQWLRATGSLTARLRQHGSVRVQVLSQGTQRLTRPERLALKQVSGHVREVLLWVNDEPVVWARSATSQRALRGPWKALKGLGTRPLAELLFSHQRVIRGPLVRHPWRCAGPEHLRMRRAWPETQSPMPRWARASVFQHHGQGLRVMESLSPGLARWRT